MLMRRLDDLLAYANERRSPVGVACPAADDVGIIESLRLALDDGIARPVVVGDTRLIEKAAAAASLSLDGFEIESVPDTEQAAVRAVELVREGRADILMKGRLATKTLMHAALSREGGLRGKGILSHVAIFDNAFLGKLIAVTDAGVNIRPNLSQKMEIVKNAADVMRRLGVARPKVAMLAAVETVELPAMPATVDAKLIEKMAAAGLLGDVDVEGPLSFDAAISPDAARLKEVGGPVAGEADIVVVPDIEAGNILYKAIAFLARQDPASIVWGGRAPMVVASRADSVHCKLLGIALAATLLEKT